MRSALFLVAALVALPVVAQTPAGEQGDARVAGLVDASPLVARTADHVRNRTQAHQDDAARRALRGRLVQVLTDTLDAPALAAADAFFQSAVGQRTTDLEHAYYARPLSDRIAFSDGSAGHAQAQPRARRSLVGRIVDARWVRDADLRITRGLIAQLARDEPATMALVRESGEDTRSLDRARAQARIAPQSYHDFVSAFFEDLSEDDLRAVAAFYESPAGQAVNEAGSRVVTEAVVNAFVPELVQQWADAEAGVPPPPPPPPPARDAPEVFDVVEQQPELIGGLEALQRAVEYPAAAREAGIQGRVFVVFVVDEQGRVTDPVVTRSPSPLLSEAALAAVRGVRFVPGQHRGRPVRVRFALPINFVLHDDVPPAPRTKAPPKGR